MFDEADLVEEMKRAHGVHTLLLYGSRARGDATPESDIDVAGFADVPTMYRDARVWSELFLDGFVYPTTVLTDAPTDELLKLSDARVVLDERGLAMPLLQRIAALQQQPVEPLPATEMQMRLVWARKTLARIRRGDIEANYRFHWLLFQLLEDHYPMIGKRYPGPKLAFADLASRDPTTFAAFERALVPGAAFAATEALVEHLEQRFPAHASSKAPVRS